jgi:hypothetical protein
MPQTVQSVFLPGSCDPVNLTSAAKFQPKSRGLREKTKALVRSLPPSHSCILANLSRLEPTLYIYTALCATFFLGLMPGSTEEGARLAPRGNYLRVK